MLWSCSPTGWLAAEAHGQWRVEGCPLSDYSGSAMVNLSASGGLGWDTSGDGKNSSGVQEVREKSYQASSMGTETNPTQS